MTSAAYITALQQSGTIADTVLQQQRESMEDRLNQNIDHTLTMRDITSEIPNIEQPVVKASAEMIASEFRTQFPSASPEQIRNMVQRWFAELSSAVNPTPKDQDTPANKESEPTNWLEFAGFTPPAQPD